MAQQILLHHSNKSIKRAFVGFSWTSLLFGLLVPLIRKDWKMALVIFGLWVSSIFGGVVGAIFYLIWTVVFAFTYNKAHLQYLLAQGYKPDSKNDKSLVSLSGAKAINKTDWSVMGLPLGVRIYMLVVAVVSWASFAVLVNQSGY